MATNTITTKGVLIINGKQVDNTFSKLMGTVKKLDRELKKLPEGSKEFVEKAKQLKLAQKAFNKVKNEIDAVKNSTDRAGGVLSRFFSKLGTTVFDIFKGISLSNIFNAFLSYGQKTTEELLQIADAITDVQKTSGLAAKEVRELWNEFSEFDTRTKKLDLMKIAEIGGRLGINNKKELKAFTEEIDKAYVALGDSFSGGLEAVTNQLGKMKNLFIETADLDYPTAINRVGSALNELAAQGTSSEENISDFAMRVGQLPNALKPAADKTLGLGAAFEESGINAQIASSGYSRFITRAAENIEDFAYSMQMSVKEAKKLINERPEEFFLRFSEGMKGLDATETSKIFSDLKLNTQEITKAVGAAGQNANRFREMMKLSSEAMADATSLSDEFNKKNNNSAAIWEKIGKTIKDYLTGKKVNDFFTKVTEFFGWITGVSNEAGNGIKTFTERISFFIKIITVATTALISYKTAILLTTKVTKNAVRQNILYNAVTKIGTVLKKAQTGATLLLSAAEQLLSRNIKGAAFAMKRFNVVTKMNPLGLLLGVIAAVVVAYQMFKKEAKAATIQQQIFNDVTGQAAQAVAKEQTEVKKLLKLAQNEKASKESRIKAIKELNKISPEYLGGLTLEKIKTEEATTAVENYLKVLKQKALQEALSSKRVELEKEAVEIEMKRYALEKEGKFTFEERGKLYKQSLQLRKRIDTLDAISTDLEKERLKARDANRQKELIELGNWYNKQLKLAKGNGKKIAKLNKELKLKKEAILNRNEFKNTDGNKNRPVDEDDKNKNSKNRSLGEYKKALDAQTKANRKLLQLEQKLQDEKRQLQKDGLDKEVEDISISYERKKIKIQQENEDLQHEIDKTNNVIANLQTKKANTTNPNKQKEYNDALNVYHEINQKRIDAKKINDAIIVQLESTKQFKIKTLKVKAFTEEQQLNFKELDLKKQDAINEINSISSLDEAKEQLRNVLSKKELSKIKTITQAKEVLRKEANKKALKLQINYLKTQQAFLQKELQTITDPQAREALLKQLNFLSEKLKAIKASLQLKNEEGGVSAKDTEYEQLDILGFSVKQWEETFVNLDTTKGKLKAVGMAMQALANAGTMYTQLQQANNEKELKNFTSYQEKRKKHLKWQLDNGLISQEKYAKSVEKLDTDLANKKAELEYKQAKAEKTANILKIIGSTAVAVSQALPNLILAGIVGAMGAVQLGIASAQPLPTKPSYAKGGYTKGLGFTDETGHEVAGAVHANEYVIPEWMLNQPRVANIAGWLETKRTGTSTGFEEGGYTTTNENRTADVTFKNQDTTLLATAIIRLNELLEKLENDGVEAFLLSDAQNGKQMHKAIKEFQKIQNKNKR